MENRMASIAPLAHSRGKHTTDNWITPKLFLDRLGPFDLDPCSFDGHPWPFAPFYFSQNGLELSWLNIGTSLPFVWLNPPYGKQTGLWLAKMAEHNHGIALIFARTETKMFFGHVWPKASALLFVRGRVTFHYPDGKASKAGHNSGGPSVLIGYGKEARRRLELASDLGAFILLGRR